MQPNLFRMASELKPKEEGIGEILQANDSLIRVIDRYKRVMGEPEVTGTDYVSLARTAASLPGLRHLQLSIACCMQIPSRKAWENRPRTIMSESRHRGWCPMKDLKARSYNVRPRAGGWSVRKAASIPLVGQGTWDESMQT